MEEKLTQEEMLEDIAKELGLTREQTEKMMRDSLEKCNNLPVEERQNYIDKTIDSYLVAKMVREDGVGKDKTITKEDKYMAIVNFPNVKITKELQAEIKKDRQVWEGLTQQVLKVVKCAECGWCCKLNKAQVSELEIARIRKYLGVSLGVRVDFGEFMNKYVERQPGGLYFHAPCSFLDDNNRCKVYPVRPYVCRRFPIDFYVLTIGECHIGNYLADLNEEWFNAMTEKMGIIREALELAVTDESKAAFENDQRYRGKRIGIDYDKVERNCRLTIIDRQSLYLVLKLVEAKRYKPLKEYSLEELRSFAEKR